MGSSEISCLGPVSRHWTSLSSMFVPPMKTECDVEPILTWEQHAKRFQLCCGWQTEPLHQYLTLRQCCVALPVSLPWGEAHSTIGCEGGWGRWSVCYDYGSRCVGGGGMGRQAQHQWTLRVPRHNSHYMERCRCASGSGYADIDMVMYCMFHAMFFLIGNQQQTKIRKNTCIFYVILL